MLSLPWITNIGGLERNVSPQALLCQMWQTLWWWCLKRQSPSPGQEQITSHHGICQGFCLYSFFLNLNLKMLFSFVLFSLYHCKVFTLQYKVSWGNCWAVTDMSFFPPRSRRDDLVDRSVGISVCWPGYVVLYLTRLHAPQHPLVLTAACFHSDFSFATNTKSNLN